MHIYIYITYITYTAAPRLIPHTTLNKMKPDEHGLGFLLLAHLLKGHQLLKNDATTVLTENPSDIDIDHKSENFFTREFPVIQSSSSHSQFSHRPILVRPTQHSCQVSNAPAPWQSGRVGGPGEIIGPIKQGMFLLMGPINLPTINQ